MTKMTRKKAAERAEAVARLRKLLRPGSEVYTVIKHVARSGMSRQIALMVVRKKEIWDISGFVATALGWRWVDSNAVQVSGCGMDMAFHIVYELGRVLFPEGGPAEVSGRRGRPGQHEPDGGYLLHKRSL